MTFDYYQDDYSDIERDAINKGWWFYCSDKSGWG